MSINKKTILAAFVLIASFIWVGFLVPQVNTIPKDFSYSAEMFSLDNFYDEANQRYYGEQRSETKFAYEVVGIKDGNLLVKNSFEVRKVTGESIISVERLYGINAKTGEHQTGYGDRDRYGYLFAPKNLAKGQSFAYWHVNYDGPANMMFVREKDLFGLKVYEYETYYQGVKIDQTKSLTHLPGVGVTKGVELVPHLKLWIEPVTGRLIKFKDDTIAYYYDLKTGQRLHPWNHFSNTYEADSVLAQVKLAKADKFRLLLIQQIIPAVLVILIGLIGLFHYSGSVFFKRSLIGILSLTTLIGVGIWVGPKLNSSIISPPLEEVRLGISKAAPELSGLIYIAENQNLFKKNGLNVVQVPEENGIVAQKNALKEVTDIATTVEFAFVSDSFDSSGSKILATINRSNFIEIIGRRDRGIETVADLKGKKIGVVAKSASEFSLGKFLILNNLAQTDVEIVYLAFGEMQATITSGAVDAVAVNDPFAYQIQSKLGANGISWSAQKDRGVYWIVVSSDNYIKTHPQAVENFVKSLVEAEDYLKANQEDGKKIIKNKLALEQEYLDYIWPRNFFGVSLEQGLLISMEEQARWRITNKLTNKITIPNFLDYIYADALRTVKIDAAIIY